MKIIAISDTHGQHHELHIPYGDLLIHAGDVSKRGYKAEVLDFYDWFAAQPHPYKVMIAGNHDFYFEKTPAAEMEADMPSNIIYLNDSGIEIEGLKIWGSPIQPWFYNWACNRERGEDIRKHWELIPADTDILITHGPAKGIPDMTMRGEEVGCVDLLEKILEIQPRYHICGHIHESYGIEKQKNSTFINASVLNLRYELVNPPIELEY